MLMNSVTIATFVLTTTVAAGPLPAQHTHGTHNRDSSQIIGAADAAMSGPMSDAAKKHMELSPTRRATREDSTRAKQVANELRLALARYQDTTAAVADGYRMFMPNVRTQRVFHFTNYKNAFLEALRFDPAKPTSLLYQREPDGQLKLIGAMYSAPRRMRASKLDDRVPLSIARWHKHVNWCLPKKDDAERWLERRDGLPLFGPESPIATRSACEKVGGRFYPNLFGWMIHANVFLGEDLATVFGDHH
jgi:hypothetical protein